MGTTPSLRSPAADASSIRPPGIKVAEKRASPPGTRSHGEMSCRSAVSAAREFIFRASGHACTTNEVRSCDTGGSSFFLAAVSGGFGRAHEIVAATPTKAQKPLHLTVDTPGLRYGPRWPKLE